MSLIKVAIERLLKTNPAEWLGYQLSEPQEPMPETIGKAMDMVKAKAKRAIDSATQTLQAELAKAHSKAIDDVGELDEAKAHIEHLENLLGEREQEHEDMLAGTLEGKLQAELATANDENKRLRELVEKGKKLFARCVTRISFLEKRTRISTLEGDDVRQALKE